MNRFRFYDPQLAASMPSLPFSLYQPTTQEENVKRRYESLRRVDRGTSPLRMELYDFLYGTGPTDEQLQYDPNDPQTSLLATRSVAQSGSALDALDAAARERNTAGSGYTSAAADTERINQPFRRTTGLEVDFDALQNISGRQGIADQFSQALDAFSMGGGTFDPNRLPATSFDADTGGETETRNRDFRFFEAGGGEPLSFSLGEPLFNRPDPVQGDNSDTDRVSKVTTNPAPQSVTGQEPTGQEPTTEEGQSRIRSILGMLGDNPELLSALGILGQGVGGYMQSRAQDKANKRANQEQRVNNAIAAFLDRPAEVAQADTATSKGGNILGALGAALGGVGQARMAQRAMDAESDEMQLDRESAERIAQIKADANRDVANLNLQGRGGSDDGGGSGAEDPNAILNTYMQALQASPQNTKPYAEIIAEIPFVKRYYPEAVAAMSLSETAGVALAVAVQGSKPTDRDAEALQKALPMPSDPLETQQAKLKNLRALINYGRNMQAQGNVLAGGWGASIGANGAFSASDLNKFAGPPTQASANRFGSLGSAQSIMAGN
jgi:hypothetical protein